MLLFYVDESGSGSAVYEGSTRSRYFSLAAVGIRDSSREALAREIRAVREKYFGAKAVADSWVETEIKARYIQALSNGIKPGLPQGPPLAWASVADKAKLNNFVWDVEKLFAKFRPMVFAVAVDKRRLPAGTSPVAAAYGKLYREVALRIGGVFVGESALFVADRQDEHARLFADGAIHDARDRVQGKGLRADFNLIVDTPIWLDPTLSTWDREIIQLADLVALAVRQWATEGQPPQGTAYLWRAIVPCFAPHWNETTPLKSGLTIYPAPETYPAI